MSDRHRLILDYADPYGAMILLLKRRRLELGLSQEAVDDRIGWTLGQTHKYEQGKRLPSQANLDCWTQVLGLGAMALPADDQIVRAA